MHVVKLVLGVVALILTWVAMGATAKNKKSTDENVRSNAETAYNAATGAMVLVGIFVVLTAWGMLKGTKYEKHFSLGQYL